MRRRMMPPHHASMSQNPHPPESPSIRLAGRRLFLCLTRIGWSERLAAERLGIHRTSLRRAIDGSSQLAPDLSAWLLDLEAAHLARPSPRTGACALRRAADRQALPGHMLEANSGAS